MKQPPVARNPRLGNMAARVGCPADTYTREENAYPYTSKLDTVTGEVLKQIATRPGKNNIREVDVRRD